MEQHLHPCPLCGGRGARRWKGWYRYTSKDGSQKAWMKYVCSPGAGPWGQTHAGCGAQWTTRKERPAADQPWGPERLLLKSVKSTRCVPEQVARIKAMKEAAGPDWHMGKMGRPLGPAGILDGQDKNDLQAPARPSSLHEVLTREPE